MKSAHFMCLFLCLTTTFLLSLSNPLRKRSGLGYNTASGYKALFSNFDGGARPASCAYPAYGSYSGHKPLRSGLV
jgi:hypothetical protein